MWEDLLCNSCYCLPSMSYTAKMKEQKTETEFNSNVATLERLDEYLRRAANASINDEYVTWYKYLRLVRTEVYPKMTQEERDECEKMFNALENSLRIIGSSRADKSFIYTKIDNKLDQFELFLRCTATKKGMLLTDKDFDLLGI